MGVDLLPRQLGASAEMAVEVAFGADLAADSGTWTYSEITDDVLQNPGVRITVGRGDELSQASPATCTFRVKNTLGQYTPFNPRGSNYPNVLLGVPVRVLVTLNGVDIFTRFQGEIVSWVPGWDAQGKFAYLTVTAAGSTRRLGSGSKPLRSPLTRAILFSTAATLRAYWPCEDGTTATQASSGLPGGSPMTATGTVRFGSMDYLTQSDFTVLPGTTFGLQPQPQLKDGGTLYGSCSGGSSSAWTIQAATFSNPVSDNSTVTLFSWVDSTGRLWQVNADGITADTTTLLVNGSVIATEPHIAINEDMRIDAAQSGGNINWSFKPMLAHAAITGSFAGTLGSVKAFVANPNAATTTGSLSVGQVRVWDGNTAADFKTSTQEVSAWNGYPNELATDRLTRLCTEQGVTLSLTGTSDSTMGVQRVDTFLNLLRECETADVGVLLDGLAAGLTYVCRSSLYNQAAALTIDANSKQIPADATPVSVFDDQRITNSVEVANRDGSSVVVEDTDGLLGTAAVGVFDSQYVVNVSPQTDLVSLGSWIVHIRTAEGMRYPQVMFDLAAAPELATDWLNVTPTNRLDVTNLSDQLTQHPPQDVNLLVEGWTETLNSRTWRVTANTSPYRVWEVFKIADSRLGRISPDPSTVHQNYSAGATSIKIDSSGGLWTTGAVSFDVEIRGRQIHVTNISGSSSPQTFTVTAIPADLGGGNPVNLWKPGVIPL